MCVVTSKIAMLTATPGRHLAERQRDHLVGPSPRDASNASLASSSRAVERRPCSRCPRLSPAMSSPSFSSDTLPSRTQRWRTSRRPPVMWFSTSRTVHSLARRRVVELRRARSRRPPARSRRAPCRIIATSIHVSALLRSAGPRSATSVIRRRRPSGSLRRRKASRGRALAGGPLADGRCSSRFTGVGTPWSRPRSTISPLR